MRRRLEDLLTLHENGPALLDRRPAELLDALSEHATETDSGQGPGETAETCIKQLAAFLMPAGRHSLGRLGHYEVLQVLGQGGFGIVVKAFDDTLKTHCGHQGAGPTTRRDLAAAKAVSPRGTGGGPGPARPHRANLRRRGTTGAIPGDGIHRRADPAAKAGCHGAVGSSRSGASGPADRAGLAAAHERGLIHRDIKPANILLEAGVASRVKLTDFGLARTSDDASKTQSGVIAGTPMYMAPEQAQGVQLDCRADLFSLGSVLYAMTTGHPPFRASTTISVLNRITEERRVRSAR